MKKTLAVISILLYLSTFALADIPRPDKTKNSNVKKPAVIDTNLSIRLDRNATEARLIIPRSQLKQLRAELESLDEVDSTAGFMSGGNIQTIVGGTLLSLAAGFAGIWFMRSAGKRSAARTGAVAAVLIAATGALASLVYANAGPPAEARAITGKMFSQSVHIYGFGFGKIKLEISDEESEPKLIVPNPKETKTEE